MYVRVGADSSPPSFGKVSNQLNSDLSVSSVTVTSSLTINGTVLKIGNLVIGSIHYDGTMSGTDAIILSLSETPVEEVRVGGTLVDDTTYKTLAAQYVIHTNGTITQLVTLGNFYRGTIDICFKCN